jgi:DNA-binding CsgD family transcriptional regulator
MKEKILELRRKGLTIDEIVNEVGCAKSTISYHINNNGLGVKKITKELVVKMNEYYLEHTKDETANKFDVSPATVTKYCNNKRVFLTDEDRKKNAVISVVKRRQKIKELSVDYKGGCCERCGYDKYIGALEFHHLDPTKKDFNVSKKGHCTSWEKVKKELDKCILVCANCHREVHEEERNR